MKTRSGKTPVFLVTGFLGAGKTTFLNRILKRPEFANSLVIINEFGEVSVDHLLVEESADAVFELSNGCLCCSVRGELVDTLTKLDFTKIDRVFVETTGIADPLPVFQALAFHPSLAQTLLPAPIICVYDCEHGEALIDKHDEAARQLVLADTVILSKCASDQSRKKAENIITPLNPTARIIGANEQIDEALLSTTSNDKQKSGHTATHSHAADYKSAVLETEIMFSASELFGLLQMIIKHYGDNLLRIKGHARLVECDDPVVIQVSGPIVHEPEPTNTTIDRTQLVVIVKNAETKSALDLFHAMIGSAQPDTADKEALFNNPLAVPGVRF